MPPPTQQTHEQHIAYCQQKASKSGSSFYYSFLFLPEEKKQAITALYAFCREVDDVVDECSDESIARTKLAWWRKEIQHLYAGKPTHPVSYALQIPIQHYALEASHFIAIIDGMEMDLNQNRYLDFKGLQHYCWHVASVVGILTAKILGASQTQTLQYAEKLGLAFQLTNIIRDVGDDARKGRIYLPVNELQKFNVPASDILNARYSEHFKKLMEFQYQRANALYDEAFSLLPQSDKRNQRIGLMMAAIYRTLLNEIRHSEFQVLHQRISLTPIRKLWLAWKIYVFG